jgi:transposase
MELYAGIDLHSSNLYLGVIDEQDQRLYQKRLPNDLDTILSALAPFKKDLVGVVVESTFNWYWLVDGLMDHGYRVHLANPSAIKQYEGLKHTDDRWDSFWLSHMLRLNILPEGYIYPKEHRPVRDLLRRRLLFVKHRTAHILSLQGAIARNLATRMSVRDIKKLTQADADDLFDSSTLVFAASNNIVVISHLAKIVKSIEKEVMSQVKLRKEFKPLLTIPGIGDILGLTIMLEVGDIKRFPKVGNYSSYCRCVIPPKRRDQWQEEGRK